MSRGQLQHVFAFIMMVLIAGAVLLLGYRFLHTIMGNACDAEQLRFLNTLSDDFARFSAYGSYQTPTWNAPCDTVAVCFVDASAYGDPNNQGIYPGDPTFTTDNPAIQSEVRHPSTPPTNVFLIDDAGKTTPLQLFAEKVALSDPAQPFCINATSGTFRVGLRGKGRTVLVTSQ